MTLILSRNYKGNQWLISDTLVSGKVIEGQLTMLPTGPVPASLVADSNSVSVLAMASKIEILGHIAVAYCGSSELARDAIHSLRTLHDIGMLDIAAVDKELERAVAQSPQHPLGFLVHVLHRDEIQLHNFHTKGFCNYVQCDKNTYAMGSGAPWFTRWLEKSTKLSFRSPSTAMRDYHSELASWLSSDGRDDNPLEQGFGGLFDTIVPVKIDGELRFSRLADTTTVYWPIYDEHWVLSMRDGKPAEGGDVLGHVDSHSKHNKG